MGAQSVTLKKLWLDTQLLVHHQIDGRNLNRGAVAGVWPFGHGNEVDSEN